MTPDTLRVAISGGRGVAYPSDPPYDPPQHFPELPADPEHLDPRNPVYAGVRRAFELLGMDAARQGTREWNPLGDASP